MIQTFLRHIIGPRPSFQGREIPGVLEDRAAEQYFNTFQDASAADGGMGPQDKGLAAEARHGSGKGDLGNSAFTRIYPFQVYGQDLDGPGAGADMHGHGGAPADALFRLRTQVYFAQAHII